MSADPQRFEGPSIEEVLAQVRTALGADAEIVEANKVRKGGVGGFFAKETFEVLAHPAVAAMPGGAPPRNVVDTAATPGSATTSTSTAAAGRVTTLLGLADAMNAAETDAAMTSPGAVPTTSTGPAAAADPTASRPRTRAEQVAQQVMAAHLRQTAPTPAVTTNPLPAVDDFQPLTAGELPRLSTEGTAFNDVLQRMAADAGGEIASAIEGRLPPMGEGEVPTTASSPELRSTAAFYAPVVRHDHPAAVEVPPTPSTPAPRRPAPLTPAAITPDAFMPAAAAPAEVEPLSDRTSRLLSWLERDNLPRTTLMTALRSLPQMPALPETTGLVVAVVGERRQAMQLCRQLARACDADPAEVVLASRTYSGRAIPAEQRIVDVTDASRERLSWRRRALPTFVAVECSASLSADAHTWTRDVVEQLQAHRVIGVVSACRKVDDVSRWVDGVGGVDGLALEGLEETSSPYAVLALEIPVAFLDGATATPAAWTQALMEGAPR